MNTSVSKVTVEKVVERGELCSSCPTSTLMPTHGLFPSILALHFTNAASIITVNSV